MAILRRRLRCHYCNTLARDNVLQIPKSYCCPVCDAVNYFDERGNITDPPAEEIASAPTVSYQYIQSRSPSPAMQAPVDELFCTTCLHNQAIVRRILAEYLPDEDDPTYEEKVAEYDIRKSDIERRYPQVCDNCEPRVRARIESAGYTARADHLRRIMERSQQMRTTVQTTGQVVWLRVITLAKWTYIASTVLGLFWHATALLMAPNYESWGDDTFRMDVCVAQAFTTFSVDESCVLSPAVTQVQSYAILADLLTIWWNPKLYKVTNSLTGRIVGVYRLLFIRLAVIYLRGHSMYSWSEIGVTQEDLDRFRKTHTLMMGVIILSAILTARMVRIARSRSAIEPTTAIVTGTAKQDLQASNRPTHLNIDTFDSMAQELTTSFQDGTALPPSPTLSVASCTTYATDATTPHAQRNAYFGDDDMDWTPQPRRFASQEPQIIPNQWSHGQRPSTAQPQHSTSPRNNEPHSLFSRPDHNPFRTKVVAAPKPPAHVKANPWKRAAWQPANEATTPKWFSEQQQSAKGGVGDVKGLDGIGVPRNVKRDAELFASPKLKYDNYATPKDTGLEDELGGLKWN